MNEQEKILGPIIDLQNFAEENQYHGLMEGLNVVLEEYIKDVSANEGVKIAALNYLSNSENNDPIPN